MHRAAIFTALVLVSQSACIVVGGYSTGRGWFFWPSGLLLVIMIALFLLFALRGRL